MVMAEVMALPLSAVTGIVMLPEPSKPVAVPVAAPERAMVRFAASLVALAALPVQEPDDPLQLPVRLALIVAGNVNDTLALPLTLTAVLVLVPSVIVILRAVPQLAVVMLAVPSNAVPLIVRFAASFVASPRCRTQAPASAIPRCFAPE